MKFSSTSYQSFIGMLPCRSMENLLTKHAKQVDQANIRKSTMSMNKNINTRDKRFNLKFTSQRKLHLRRGASNETGSRHNPTLS